MTAGSWSDEVVAVVLSYRRPALATQVVRSLVDTEAVPASQVVLVVNGEGGLDDPGLEASIRVVRLPQNLGPAGGFRHGMMAATDLSAARWLYVCEDDVGLFSIPAPRVARLVEEAEALEQAAGGQPIGAVVAYGRDLDARTGGTSIHHASDEVGLEEVDAGSWGASLLSRRVVEAGILPEESWFFGYEDFDFWYRLKKGGFRLMVDCASARSTNEQMTSAGRDRALAGQRPLDAEEPWRAYYVARNFFHLARRHGHLLWVANHLVYSARRIQLAGSRTERLAILRGVCDGIRGRTGFNQAIGPHPSAATVARSEPEKR